MVAASPGQNAGEEALRSRAEADIVRYHAMLAAYRRGDQTDSVDALLGWSPDRLKRALGRANGPKDPFAPWHLRRYGLAVMLHTDAALRLSEDLRTDKAFSQLRIGTLLLRMGAGRSRDSVYPLARRWYRAVARYLRDRNQPFVAERLLELGRESLAKDQVLLAESGTLAESIATDYALAYRGPGQSWAPGEDPLAGEIRAISRSRLAHLNDAAQWLGRSLALEPRDELVRVHLGRVQALRSNDDEALHLLREVLAGSPDASTVYLAAMFVGAVRERQGNLEAARDAYRQAISRFPQGQSAYVALSHALQASGEPGESRDVLSTMLSRRRNTDEDPFWWYQLERPGTAVRRLAALREDVRR